MRGKAESGNSVWALLVSMLLFGTIGLFRRWIPVPSGFLAMTRGLVGAAVLLMWYRASGKHMDRQALRDNRALLLLSGTAIGFNWILLFEAYRYTTVAVATLCYYMMPAFLTIASPLVLREKITRRSAICAALALLGMIPVSGVLGETEIGSVRGILLGLAAAVLYTSVVLMNKKMVGVSGLDRTIPQLMIAGAVLIPYVLLTEREALRAVPWTWPVILLTAVVAVVHTGVAYGLYFTGMAGLPAGTVALLSYVDPVTAILLSTLLLGETMTPLQWAGTALILGALFAGVQDS